MAYEAIPPKTGTVGIRRAHSEDKYLVTLTTEDGTYEFQMLGHVFRAALIGTQQADTQAMEFDSAMAISLMREDGR